MSTSTQGGRVVKESAVIELLIVVSVIAIIAAIAIPEILEAKRVTERAEAGKMPLRFRLDYIQWDSRIQVWCDTLTGTRLYKIVGAEGGGIAAVPGGCEL